MASNSTLKGTGLKRQRLASPGRGQNIWTNDQRLYVHLLKSKFDFSNDAVTAVFNTLFADHQRNCGLGPEGLPKTRITAQYSESRKETISANWREVLKEPVVGSEEDRRRQLMCEQIRRTARTMNAATLSQDVSRPSQQISPISATSKRTRSSVTTDEAEIGSDEEYSPSTRPKRAKIIVRSEPDVVIPVTPRKRGRPPKSCASTPALLTPPSRTGSISRYTHNPDGTVAFQISPNSEKRITITAKRFAKSLEDLDPIDEGLARPLFPNGLFFRYTDSASVSQLTSNSEFIAGRFQSVFIDPPKPPTLEEFPWADGAIHINKHKIATPFVSVTCSLNWCIRLALAEARKGVEGGRITVIHSSAISQKSIFHALKFTRELRKKIPFEGAKYLYQGQNEYWVWAKIPAVAVGRTFTVQDLLNMSAQSPAVNAALRLDSLSQHRVSYASTTLPVFKAQGVPLTPGVIGAIAKICKFLEADAGKSDEAKMTSCSQVVASIIQDWGFKVDPCDWSKCAGIFASTMAHKSSYVLQFKMKMAYITGVQMSFADAGSLGNAERARVGLGRARKIGLDSPAKLLTDEMDALRLSIETFEEKRLRRIHARGRPAPLTDASHTEEEDDEPLGQSGVGAGSVQDEDDIMYEEED